MRNTLIYGSIGGIIMVASWFVNDLLFSGAAGESMDVAKSEWVGFLAMVLAMVVTFMGVRKDREMAQAHAFSFGKGFKSGLNMVLVASLIYVVGWMIYYPVFMPDFMSEYQTAQVEVLQESGLSEEELDQKKQELSDWMELYEHPLIMAGITFLEFFPIGLLGALIAAFVLKRKN